MESNLNISINEYQGPLDVLLELVHKKKYDIKKLPILDLCNQYLRFIDNIKSVNIDLASEYLLMAAIMIFLKSKFLLIEFHPTCGTRIFLSVLLNFFTSPEKIPKPLVLSISVLLSNNI